MLGGFNIRGYRGPVAHQRQPNDIRIVFAGGTRAFGWGEPVTATTVASVRFEIARVIDQPGAALRPLEVINLGQLGALPESYPATFDRYASLHPDYIGILDDLGERGPNPPFAASGIFMATGYRPILPLVLHEKGAIVGSRMIGVPLECVGSALATLDRWLARGAGTAAAASATSPDAYADAMIAAIDAAHRHARGVVVALAPIDTEPQRRNFDVLSARLAARGKAPWLRIVDLSEHADLYDPQLRLDGFSFGASASSLAAQAIAPAFLDLLRADPGSLGSRF